MFLTFLFKILIYFERYSGKWQNFCAITKTNIFLNIVYLCESMQGEVSFNNIHTKIETFIVLLTVIAQGAELS